MTEKTWKAEDAREIYNIAHWSDGYFDINEQGELVATLKRKDKIYQIAFPQLVSSLRSLGLTLPVLVRFSNILHDRAHWLTNAFAGAKETCKFQGEYTPVYPIKVNQQRRVVEQILKSGVPTVGLEAGSKPELMVVMALSKPGQVIICNGYKDREYIRLALIGRKLKFQIYLIIEKLSELDFILEESQHMGIEPLLGVRIRLSSVGKGKWQNTGGEKSKFGLTASQLLSLVSKLKEKQKESHLQLIHFHLGSQVANLHDIKNALNEAARYYAHLHAMGMDICTVDVGGGLGVDYEGTRSRSDCSINYSIEDYALAVVSAFASICEQFSLPHPGIITEAGRAMVAHHAVLITQVIDKENLHSVQTLTPPSDQAPASVQALWEIYQQKEQDQALEIYHQSGTCLAKCHEDFNQGRIDITGKALGEDIYYAIAHFVRNKLSANNRLHTTALNELNEKLADKLFCNFSVFQSIPDAWAIKQVFPIMPLQGLLEKPTGRGVIQDLTCDSDGRIDAYVDGQGIESSLPLPPHDLSHYCLGIFLVGAYQEILGDMHNLFGDTDSVHVELDESGQFQLVEPLLGDRVDSVLRTVHFDPQHLMYSYKLMLEQASDISPEKRRSYLDMLASGLIGYTYLED